MRRGSRALPLWAALITACAAKGDADRARSPGGSPSEAEDQGGEQPSIAGPLIDLGPAPSGPLEVVRAAATPRPKAAEGDGKQRQFTGLEEIWRARIGRTTYRSTIHVTGDWVVVNSNGEDPKSTNDRTDVVWVLRAETGEEVRRIKPPGGGEKDCNGVALADDHLVFGTDQGVVYRYDWFGRLQWQRSLDGDVEAAPALVDLDLDGTLDVAVGSEGGSFYAIEGTRGRVLWRHRGGKGDYDQFGFVGAPAIADLDGNGTPDVLVPSRDQVFRALDGRNGKELWRHKSGSGMHSSPILIDVEGDGALEVAFSEAYRRVYLADAASGRVRWTADVGYGLKAPLGYFPDAGCILAATAWNGAEEQVACLDQSSGALRWKWTERHANITSGFVVGDIDGSPGQEVVFGTEAGRLVVLDAEGREVWIEDLGGPVECTPTLADVDEDGTLDVLVAGNDGFLRVFRSAGFPPAAIGYHRGDRKNRGQLP